MIGSSNNGLLNFTNIAWFESLNYFEKIRGIKPKTDEVDQYKVW